LQLVTGQSLDQWRLAARKWYLTSGGSLKVLLDQWRLRGQSSWQVTARYDSVSWPVTAR